MRALRGPAALAVAAVAMVALSAGARAASPHGFSFGDDCAIPTTNVVRVQHDPDLHVALVYYAHLNCVHRPREVNMQANLQQWDARHQRWHYVAFTAIYHHMVHHPNAILFKWIGIVPPHEHACSVHVFRSAVYIFGFDSHDRYIHGMYCSDRKFIGTCDFIPPPDTAPRHTVTVHPDTHPCDPLPGDPPPLG